MQKRYHLPCNIAQSLNLIGDRWSMLLLHAVLAGCHTYGELQEELEGIPTNLLSQRLRELVEEGLLTSKLYSEHPPRYRYDLTEAGRALRDVFNVIVLWGDRYLPTSYKCLRHGSNPVRVAYVDEQTGEVLSADDLAIETLIDQVDEEG